MDTLGKSKQLEIKSNCSRTIYVQCTAYRTAQAHLRENLQQKKKQKIPLEEFIEPATWTRLIIVVPKKDDSLKFFIVYCGTGGSNSEGLTSSGKDERVHRFHSRSKDSVYTRSQVGVMSGYDWQSLQIENGDHWSLQTLPVRAISIELEESNCDIPNNVGLYIVVSKMVISAGVSRQYSCLSEGRWQQRIAVMTSMDAASWYNNYTSVEEMRGIRREYGLARQRYTSSTTVTLQVENRSRTWA